MGGSGGPGRRCRTCGTTPARLPRRQPGRRCVPPSSRTNQLTPLLPHPKHTTPYLPPWPQGVLPGLPGLPSLVTALDRSWSSDAAKQEPTAPALVYSLGQLEEQLKKAYRTVTEGKFR